MKDQSLQSLAMEKVIIFDGATGTEIQACNPTVDDFGGSAYEGCNEILSLTRPSLIQSIHEKYISAGAEGIKTNTFGAAEHVLSKYSLSDKTYAVNYASAKLAREVARSYSRKIFVVGSVGPGTKLPTLGQISYDELLKSYTTQFEGLIDGGVDVVLIETCQDILQSKIAVRAALNTIKKRSQNLPVMLQVTIESQGHMLLGTDIQAALTTMRMFPLTSFGLNCSTGPDEMRPSYSFLSDHCPFLLSCMPNAGIPEIKNGKTIFPLDPQQFGDKLFRLVSQFGINIVGGCCGTTPQHIAQLSSIFHSSSPKTRQPAFENAVASLYSAVTLDQTPKPLLIGERTNANGSSAFRKALQNDDFDALLAIAKNEMKDGAHLIDCCLAFVGRNELADMKTFLSRAVTSLNIPIMIDSTDPLVIEESLKVFPGKAIVNSVNFEDGEERLRHILSLCKTFGASVVGLTIDEEGMAKTLEKKIVIAKRLHSIAVGDFGLNSEDLIIDPLTFTLASGDEELKNSANETLMAISRIKVELPGVKTNLGVSNISYGLKPHVRSLLNSTFLFYAVKSGLDMAICNKQKVVPLYKIEKEHLKLMEDLVFNRRKPDYDPLKVILKTFADVAFSQENPRSDQTSSAEESLIKSIIEGDRHHLSSLIKQALGKYSATDILNNFLLEGMKIVGEKFASGEMQLPFVLESAETMSRAVSELKPHMQTNGNEQSGKTVMLATVKGDVHDIGKNLVKIIFTNNGFQVIDLGIKQPIEAIIEKIEELKPDVLGLSGLLVKSTQVMKANLVELQNRCITIPVLLGGAALQRRYVEEECQSVYNGPVFYAKDAFQGLNILKSLENLSTMREVNKEAKAHQAIRGTESSLHNVPKTTSSSFIKKVYDSPTPPLWGTQIINHVSLESIFPFLDTHFLIQKQWQLSSKLHLSKKRTLEKLGQEIIELWYARAKMHNLLAPKAIYGYFSCRVDGTKLFVYPSPDSHAALVCFDFPRQTSDRLLSLSDFFCASDPTQRAVLPLQIVTMGDVSSKFSATLYEQEEFKEYFYFHGFAVLMAEAFAEWLHAKIRKELKISDRDHPEMRRILNNSYQGARLSFGYPACPNLEDNKKLFTCLNPERIGLSLSETHQIVPEISTSALIAWHPDACYFSVT